jgi:hypothetical protein
VPSAPLSHEITLDEVELLLDEAAKSANGGVRKQKFRWDIARIPNERSFCGMYTEGRYFYKKKPFFITWVSLLSPQSSEISIGTP